MATPAHHSGRSHVTRSGKTVQTDEGVFMKTVLLLLLVLAVPCTASALGVSDATTHIYLSEQVKQLTEQLEKAQQQINEAIKANEILTKTYEDSTATYDRAKGVYDDIMQTRRFLYNEYSSLMGQYRKFKGYYDDLKDADAGDLESFKDILDGFYGDSRLQSAEERAAQRDKQYDLIQGALKKSLEDGEQVLAALPEQTEKAAELSKEIGQTASPKDEQALTNRFLSEILTVLQTQLALTTKYHQAMGLMNYTGVNEDSIKARQDALRGLRAKQDELTWRQKEIKKRGLTSGMTMREHFEAAKNRSDNVVKF
jgi:chromosome segregation ATPase